MYFEASNYKERKFLNLNDNNRNSIHPTYLKDRSYLKHFSLSNLLYAHITRLIINYTPISKYRQSFFPNISNACLYNNSPIKTRSYILHDCKQYKKSWNPKQESLKDIYYKIN